LVVVFVPSLCWVVELVLDCPLGFEAEVVLVDPFAGSLALVVLDFSPLGFSVVVVLELVCANAAVLSARPRPIALTTPIARNFDIMVFSSLYYAVPCIMQCLSDNRMGLTEPNKIGSPLYSRTARPEGGQRVHAAVPPFQARLYVGRAITRNKSVTNR
jgi:hypothetical protein